MTDKIVDIGCVTTLDIPPDKILKNHIGSLDSVVLMGYDKQGNEVFASSFADGGDTLWIMERMKMALLTIKEE